MLEIPARIEPCLFESDVPAVLADLAVDIQGEAATLGGMVDQSSLSELADLVRMMNCYYSNLIEGHNTKPVEIEKALAGATIEIERRPLALEAKAHVEVQRGIDIAYLEGKLLSPTSQKFILATHRIFYEEMPEEFRKTVAEEEGGRTVDIVPGKFRNTPQEDISVGRHVPPSSEVVQNFMDYFEKRFSAAEGKGSGRIIAIATAHHRFNFIHPFVDGNGRVSRLMSHAMGLRAGIGGAGLWSISRGLARGLAGKGEYKLFMDSADSQRRGDRDGRGNLSEAALAEFSEWFLSVMLDQIRFSKAIFRLDRIQERYKDLLIDRKFDAKSIDLVASVFKFGALERGDVPQAMRVPDRTARFAVKKLTEEGFLKSDTPRGPLRIAFPLSFRERLFPNLFADEAIVTPEPPTLRLGR